MNRRNFTALAFLSGLGLVALPNTPKAESKRIVLYGDGRHDDSEAMQAWLDGKDVYATNGQIISKDTLPGGGEHRICKTLVLNPNKNDEHKKKFNFNNSCLRASRSWSNWFRRPDTLIHIITK